MIQSITKNFRIRKIIKIPHTCTSWSKCMTCIFLRSGFWLSNICDASMPHFSYLPKTPLKSLSGRIWKWRQKYQMPWWSFIHIWAIERIIWGTYIFFANLIKSPDRWLIKEWMIGDSIITVLSCNRPRTWKSYTPHRDEDKGWIKC